VSENLRVDAPSAQKREEEREGKEGGREGAGEELVIVS